jgi:two-component system alkaline phosphatase synthesis response regulator PhoP
MAPTKRRILLVDDEESMLQTIGKRLEVAGFDVITAADGEEALLKARTGKAELVILDVMLPRLNGYEVCARLKQDPALRHLPVIMFTAKGDVPQEHLVGLLFGADAYLSKSVGFKELAAQVEALLGKK